MTPVVPPTPDTDATQDPRHRGIQSFVRRAGRVTRAQERALSKLWPQLGVPRSPSDSPPAVLDLDALFGRQAPRVLEIGFGNGAALVSHAQAAPDRDFIGIEVHPPGVGHCLLEIERLGLTNVRLFMEDAVGVLRDRIPEGSLAGVHLFFPDPWHKKRHHKRRLVQPEFVALLASRLAPGGYFHVATDWAPYAEHIAAVLTASGRFRAEDPGTRARSRTRFEARGERLGHPIWERAYVKA
jgi:tRNA (guanine-N7-)-methyltransferase